MTASSPSILTLGEVDLEAQSYETTHVHEVYANIATHFSETRYKPWPVVDGFLRGLIPGAIGLDVGCGNGKYLGVRDDIYILASDYSTELVKIASQYDPHSTLVADTLNLPHAQGTFDFAICIAVIHHFSTQERRIEAVRHVLEKLRPRGGMKKTLVQNSERIVPQHIEHEGLTNDDQNEEYEGGEALFFVWALEQKSSRRGWDEGNEQDVLVPWVLKGKAQHARPADGTAVTKTGAFDGNRTETQGESHLSPRTFHRYYHLYRRGELEEDVIASGGKILRSGYDRDNWWCVARRDTKNLIEP